MKKILPILFLSVATISCAQKTEKIQTITSKKQQTMDLNKITNPTVKNAIEALQNNDKTAFYTYFTQDAVFTDDGNQLNLKSFFDNAFNHKEKFLSLDKIENDGKNLAGNFFAGQWGTFRVFFNFTINEEGKISKLDIGQGK